MDMEVGLDPLHQEWVILIPVDCYMKKVQTRKETAYTRFETGEGRNKVVLALAYSNTDGDNGTVDVTKPGTVNIHWAKGKKGSGEVESVHWTVRVSDFTIANDIARQFMLHLPAWLEPEPADW